MSWAVYPAPVGSEHGPCKNEKCGHSDCATQRIDANQVCPDCHKVIGYDHRVYRDKAGLLRHALCVEQASSYSNTIDNPRSDHSLPIDDVGTIINRLSWLE